MRRVVLLVSLAAVCLVPTVASAKLPFFRLEVVPLRPAVGEPLTITMTCFEDAEHAEPWGSCLGAGGTMGWIHPLDEHGELDRDDWIEVLGRAAAGGSTRAKVVLREPGAYDVLPLYRRWGYDQSPGFPHPIRIKVGGPPRPVPMALAALGIVGAAAALVWRRRGKPVSR